MKIPLASLLVSVSALAAGVSLAPSTRFEFTDCAAGGSAAQTVPAGSFLFRATDESVFICFASTCVSGGEKFPAGTVMLLNMPGGSVSCRSAASTGDAIFTNGG